MRLLGENLIAFETRPASLACGQQLPAPRRVAVLRTQRGGRPALRLPRLEVRRRRPVRRHAQRAGRERLQDQGQGHGLPVRRAQRHRLDLYGPARDAAAAARLAPNLEPTARSGCGCRSPTGCRRSRATSTPSTPSSCTPATSAPRRACRAATRTTSPSSGTDGSSPRSTRSGRATRPFAAEPGPEYWRWATSCCPCTR